MTAAVPVPGPNNDPVVAPQPAPPPVGRLDNREIVHLRTACFNKHAENGTVIARILLIAALIAAIFAAVAIEGFLGILIGAAIYLGLGHAACQVYHDLRSSDYRQAGQALSTTSFNEYIQAHRVDCSIDNIVQVHQMYKAHVANQAQRLQAVPG